MESVEQASAGTPQAQAGGASSPAGEHHASAPTSTNTVPPLRSRMAKPKGQGGAGALSVRSMNFNIPTIKGAHDHAEQEHGKDSWRYKALHFLHSSKVQKILMGLLFADVIILFLELLFLATYPHCSIIVRDAISCCPSTDEEVVAHENLRWLELEEEEHSGAHDFCNVDESGLSAFQDYPAACDEHKWQAIHTTEEVLFALTVTILCIFFVELNVTMVALTPQIFFRQFFFLLDYIIITVSLALELTFYFLDDAIYQSAAGFLVLARVWRFVRIGHAIVEITNEMAHEEYNGLLAYTEALENLLQQHEIPVPESRWTRLRASSHGGGGGGSDHNKNSSNILSEIELAHREELRQKFNLTTADPGG